MKEKVPISFKSEVCFNRNLTRRCKNERLLQCIFFFAYNYTKINGQDHMYSSDDVVNISYHNVKNLCSNKHDSMNLDGLSNFF